MKQRICRKILYGWMGFRKEVSIPHPDKFIVCLAPHTSNWDFIIGILYSRAEKLRCKFMMKKEWFWWPLGYVFRAMGGIPVYRTKQMNATDVIAKQAVESDIFHLCITPEGTRKNNPEWKKGFYYIALNANIPILLYGIDYRRKLIKCTSSFIPTGDVENDIPKIKSYFTEFSGKHPEKFSI